MKPIDKLLNLMAQLRDKEKGCPWDIEQNFASIAPHTLEEAYEVVDAIEKNDMQNLQEELGDLLLQVVFHSQMANEQHIFSFDDVVDTICNKLINRHPHVFADAKIKTAAEQTEAWEKIKEEEKAVLNFKSKPNILDGIPNTLPSLARAFKLQKKAARAGFDWQTIAPVFEKLQEEIEELKYVLEHENNKEQKLEELGDIIFSCVNLARKLDIDPDQALRFCNKKFETRLGYIQAELDNQQRIISEASFQELNELWDQAKILESSEKLNQREKE